MQDEGASGGKELILEEKENWKDELKKQWFCLLRVCRVYVGDEDIFYGMTKYPVFNANIVAILS